MSITATAIFMAQQFVFALALVFKNYELAAVSVSGMVFVIADAACDAIKESGK